MKAVSRSIQGGTIEDVCRDDAREGSGWRASHPDLLPIGVVIACVVVGNILALTGAVDENPINWLSGLAIVSHPGITVGQNTIDPSVGWITQGLGHYAATQLLHGHVPWWNPYEGIGSPLVGEMGSAALFPLTILEVFANGHLYAVIILEVIAGVATYLLARGLVASRWAAAAAGSAYGLAGTFSWISHAVINPVPFLPVILLGVERSFSCSQTGRRLGWSLIAVGISLAIYGGFPEEVYWFVPLIACWTSIRVVMSWRSGRLRYFVGKLSLGGAAGFLLAGPLLVAFLTYLPHTLTPPHVPAYATSAAPAAQLATQVTPYMYGPIGGLSAYDPTSTVASMWSHAGGYLDSSLLLFAAIGALGRRNRVFRMLLLGSLLVSFARLAGLWPVDELFGLIPGAWISFERYADPWWELSAAVLAGFGVDDIIGRRVSARRLGAGIVVSLGAVGVAYGVAHGALADVWRAPRGPSWIIGSALWAVGVVIIGVIGWRVRSSLGIVLVVGVMMLDASALYMVPQLASQRSVVNSYGVVRFLKSHLGTARFMTLGPIAPNYGSYFRIPELNVEDIPIAKGWGTLVANTLDPGIGGINSSFNFIGVTFWQSPGAPSVENEVLGHVGAYEGVGTKYLIVPAAEATGDGKLSAAGFQKVWSKAGVEVFRFPQWEGFYSSAGSCELSKRSLASVVASCRRPARLVRRELYLPGWQAVVNGHGARISRAGRLFQGVRLPAGRSSVRFVFRPPHIVLGWMALGAGGAVLLGSWVLSAGMSLRERKRPGKHVRVGR